MLVISASISLAGADRKEILKTRGKGPLSNLFDTKNWH